MPSPTSTQGKLATVVDLLGYAKRAAARTDATPQERRHAANIAHRRNQILGSQTPAYTPPWPGGGLSA